MCAKVLLVISILCGIGAADDVFGSHRLGIMQVWVIVVAFLNESSAFIRAFTTAVRFFSLRR